MALILSIETSSENCSVAISNNGKILTSSQSDETKSHATILTVLIEQQLKENAILLKELDAVAVSKGPGSYTGLRIGVSVAKGICYGTGKPLIAINTLQGMMNGLKLSYPDFETRFSDDILFCPMLDARRQEVYLATFSKNGDWINETTAEIIEENSFKDVLKDKKIVFFGSGSDKVSKIIHHENAIFVDAFTLKAEYLSFLAESDYQTSRFEDLAYFEPLYLKDFVATTPKRKIF